MPKQFLINLIMGTLIFFFVAFGVKMVLAWTSPTVAPPGGNIAAPQVRVSGTCATGSAMRVINVNGSVTCETAGGSGVPAGMIAFFASATCPSGWTEYTAVRGRLILGLPVGGTVAGTKGTAIGNLAALPVTQHNHSASSDSAGSHFHGSAVGCSTNAGCGSSVNRYVDGDLADTLNTTSAGSHSHIITVNNAGDVNGPPYLQLLACQKN